MSFVVAQVDYDYPDREIEKQIIEAAGGVLKSAHLLTEDEVIEFAADADAIIVQYAPITRKVLESLPKCKIVSRYGIGIDNVDVKAAKELGIYVAHNPQYCINEVSDHAIAMILSLQRHITRGTQQVKQGIWDFTRLVPVKAADRTTIGLVGFGNIGRRTAEKLKVFGFSIIAYDPYVSDEVFKEYGVSSVSLEHVMEQSDCISVHCALTEETVNLIDEKMLSLMKTDSFIVNTSRGPVIDIEALSVALEMEKIHGAALDVLPNEPPHSFDRISHMPTLLLTPHIAFYSETSIIELRSTIAEQVVQVMKGDVPRFNAY